MKVLILSTFDTFGGAGIAALRLHKALLKSGLKSDMLVQEKKTNDKNVHSIANSWVQKKLALFRFATDRLQFSFYEKDKSARFIFSQAEIGVDLSNNALVKEADIIHLHWVNFGFLSLNSIQKLIATGKPIIITLHDMWTFTGGCHYSKECTNYIRACGNCLPYLKHPNETDLSRRRWNKKAEIFSHKNLTIVPCSEWLASKARQSSLLKDKKVVPVPNPIDVSVFKPEDKTIARKFFNLNPDKKYILFAAMKVSDERKGFAFFKSGLETLAKKYSNELQDTELLIFGLYDEQDFAGIPFKINSLGRLSDMSTIVNAYSAASVFVIPSLEDNLPNTVMESLACGTPIVSFNTGGIPEMVEHMKTGYVAEYKSSEDLAAGVYWTLFQAPYEALCMQSREKAIKDYSEESVAEKYTQLYKEAKGN
ncbi:MAG: glycosyltransferase family 4 protein [Sporocytophaga sp.]|uniref:glycosyltransferase family 4 protein n=1 Tax=Sporocytophaga sp. TaxID=2231183 RepID=UPI001B2935E2|nr:glycosyltransferase family 4 protein [Sporocytophaga sp.]MBO9700870.1 glycosyltransferase family 4 protein [Sporocytophaga sp.]